MNNIVLGFIEEMNKTAQPIAKPPKPKPKKKPPKPIPIPNRKADAKKAAQVVGKGAKTFYKDIKTPLKLGIGAAIPLSLMAYAIKKAEGEDARFRQYM